MLYLSQMFLLESSYESPFGSFLKLGLSWKQSKITHEQMSRLRFDHFVVSYLFQFWYIISINHVRQRVLVSNQKCNFCQFMLFFLTTILLLLIYFFNSWFADWTDLKNYFLFILTIELCSLCNSLPNMYANIENNYSEKYPICLDWYLNQLLTSR